MVAALIVGVLILGAGGFWAYRTFLQPAPSTASTPVATVTVTPTGAAASAAPIPTVVVTVTPPAVVPSVSPTPTPEYPAIVLTGHLCGSTGTGPYANAAAGNATTSCPFVMNVQSAYVSAGGNGTPIVISAYSPTTEKWYSMSCFGGQPATCTGGVAAIVHLYGGQATFAGP